MSDLTKADKRPVLDARYPKPQDEVVPGFRWRDRSGRFWSITEMRTGHLFYTFRMVWNNVMPPAARVGRNIHYYRFTAPYTPEYLKEACSHIYAELLRRWDRLPDWMTVELEAIRQYFYRETPVLTEGEGHE